MSLAVVERNFAVPDSVRGPDDIAVYHGLDDQEMRRTIQKLAHASVRAIPALNDRGEPAQTTPEAYHAQNDPAETADCFTVFAECRVEGVEPDMVADHHHKGDPGDLPPELYWEASTLGRISIFLETLGLPVEVTQKDKEVAAIDHCLVAAFLERCPGVSQDGAYDTRLEGIAEKFGFTVDRVEQMAKSFRVALETSPVITIGDGPVLDAIHIPLGEYLGPRYMAAQTAALVVGKAVLLRAQEGPNFKRMLTGHTSPEQIVAFGDEYAPAHGLKKLYGMPDRLYGGGYEPD